MMHDAPEWLKLAGDVAWVAGEFGIAFLFFSLAYWLFEKGKSLRR